MHSWEQRVLNVSPFFHFTEGDTSQLIYGYFYTKAAEIASPEPTRKHLHMMLPSQNIYFPETTH